MRIALTAAFYPSVGGIESLARLLASDFTVRGHEVLVITAMAGDPAEDRAFPYRVLRRPGPAELFRVMSDLDVVLQLGPMLRTGWAAIICGTPVVISHQTWVDRFKGWLLPQGWLKKVFSLFCTNIAASAALRTEPWGRTVVVPNCYDAGIYGIVPGVARDGDLIFVGRLVHDKGLDLLLEAMVLLRAEGIRPRLTVVGDGAQRPALEAQAVTLGLRGDVDFRGAQPAEEVARLLNRHRTLVVPSRWAEPFGIVALEGIACGCRVVASDGGGLRDLVGPFGRLFPRNDAAALGRALREELGRTETRAMSASERDRHLAPFTPAGMAARYFEILMAHARSRPASRDGVPAPRIS